VAKEHAEFWSTVAGKYDRVVDLQIGGKTRSMLRERIAREGHLGRAIEFGCGTGFYTDVLARKSSTLLATDLSPGMLQVAMRQVTADNVTFQIEDCQRTSLPNDTFDTAFIGLVIHFTEPSHTVLEMRRILRSGGALIIANVDLKALAGLNRVRSLIRILFHGIVGHRVKPPKEFGRNVLSEKELSALLGRSGFRIEAMEVLRDPSSSSNVPIEYARAVKA
jgi:ABC-2 type transport system ATP-binding protein